MLIECFEFGDKRLSFTNTLTYTLVGEESYIRNLEIKISIAKEQNRKLAIEKFSDIITKTLEILDIDMPNSLYNSLLTNQSSEVELENCTLKLNYEDYKILENFDFIIEGKLYS